MMPKSLAEQRKLSHLPLPTLFLSGLFFNESFIEIITDLHVAVRNNRFLIPYTHFRPKVTFAKLQYNITTRVLILIKPDLIQVSIVILVFSDNTGSKDERVEKNGMSRGSAGCCLRLAFWVKKRRAIFSVKFQPSPWLKGSNQIELQK